MKKLPYKRVIEEVIQEYFLTEDECWGLITYLENTETKKIRHCIDVMSITDKSINDYRVNGNFTPMKILLRQKEMHEKNFHPLVRDAVFIRRYVEENGY